MRRAPGKVFGPSIPLVLLAFLASTTPLRAEPLRYGEAFEALGLPQPPSKAESGGGRVPVDQGTWAGGSRIGTPQVVIRRGGTSVVVRFDLKNPHGRKPHVNVQLSNGTNEHIEVSPGYQVKVRIGKGKLTVEVDGKPVQEIKFPGGNGDDSEVEITRGPDGKTTVSKGGKKVAEIKEGEDGVTVETEEGETTVPPQQKGNKKNGNNDKQNGNGEKPPKKPDKEKEKTKKSQKDQQSSTTVQPMTLPQAIQQGLVAITVEGTGSPFSAQLRMRKMTDDPLTLIVPSGTVLEPDDGASQSLAVR